MKAHRPATARDAMRSASLSVSETATAPHILAEMERSGVDELPVLSTDGVLRGTVARRVVERRMYDRREELTTAAEISEPVLATAAPGDAIERAVDKMLEAEIPALPVVSADGRLDGLLVLDDLRQVPELVEAELFGERERAAAAGAGFEKVMLACGAASGLMGAFLFALWIEGATYGLPSWVGWVDALVALLAVVAAVAATSREMISVPLWAVAGIGLCFTALIAHSWHEGAWSTWLQMAMGVALFLLAVVIGRALPRRRHPERPYRWRARHATGSA